MSSSRMDTVNARRLRTVQQPETQPLGRAAGQPPPKASGPMLTPRYGNVVAGPTGTASRKEDASASVSRADGGAMVAACTVPSVSNGGIHALPAGSVVPPAAPGVEQLSAPPPRTRDRNGPPYRRTPGLMANVS